MVFCGVQPIYCRDMKIGLIADTHMPGAIRELWPQVFSAFEDVDLILHAGDLHTLEIVDRLQEIAPTYVAAGNGDVGIVDERLQDTWLLPAGDLMLGMIHRFPSPERKSPEHLDGYVDRHFTSAPHVVIYGHTHLECIHRVGDLVCINPGSPTLPQNQSLRLGTIGTLEVEASSMSIQILQLTDHGVVPHARIAPVHLTLC